MGFPLGFRNGFRSNGPICYQKVNEPSGGKLFHNFANKVGFELSSCTAAIAADQYQGDKVVELTATASATISIELPVGTISMVSPGLITIAWYTPSKRGTNSILVEFSGDGFVAQGYYRGTANSENLGWNFATFSIHDLALVAGTGTTDMAAVKAVRVQISSATSGLVYKIAGLRYGCQVAPVRKGLIIFDDNRDGVETYAKPALETRSQKGVLGVITSRIGTATYMTSAQVLDWIADGNGTVFHNHADLDWSQQTDGGASDMDTGITAMLAGPYISDKYSITATPYNLGGSPDDTPYGATELAAMQARGITHGFNVTSADVISTRQTVRDNPYQINRQLLEDAYYHPAASGGAAALAGAGAGNVDNGIHHFYISFYNASYETKPTRFATVTVADKTVNGQIAFTSLPVSPLNSGITGRRIYMSQVNGGPAKLLLQIADNTTTTGTGNLADASLTTTMPDFSTFPCSVLLRKAQTNGFLPIFCAHQFSTTTAAQVMHPTNFAAFLDEAIAAGISFVRTDTFFDHVYSTMGAAEWPEFETLAFSVVPNVVKHCHLSMQNLANVLATPGGSSSAVDGVVQQITDQGPSAINMLSNSNKNTLRQVTNGTKTFYAVEIDAANISAAGHVLKYSTDAGATAAAFPAGNLAYPWTVIVVAKFLTTPAAANMFLVDGRASTNRAAILYRHSDTSWRMSDGTTGQSISPTDHPYDNSWHTFVFGAQETVGAYGGLDGSLTYFNRSTNLNMNGLLLGDAFDFAGAGVIQIAEIQVLSTDGDLARLLEPLIYGLSNTYGTTFLR